jgi:hypothetical protein
MTDEIVEVYVAADEPQAVLLQDLLQTQGITAQVIGSSLHSAAGEIPVGWNAMPRLWVRQPDAEQARQLLMDWEKSRNQKRAQPPAAGWTCPRCGSEVDFDFDTCWSCLYNRLSC